MSSTPPAKNPSSPSFAAIPTIYKEIQFRSRLEARWAAFFDLCGWSWEYEPIDLAGYIPDFVLNFKDDKGVARRPMIVEVKPVLSFDQTDAVIAGAIEKIERSGWTREALLVGARIPTGEHQCEFEHAVTLGLIANVCVDYAEDGSCIDVPGCWDSAPMWKCECCGFLTFCRETMGWSCRVNGCYGGHDHIGREPTNALDLWARAGNLVQWKGRAARG